MLVAISGGIGSGKSVVARILRSVGYEVYDCDSRARQLIDNSPEIKNEIVECIGRCCISENGCLDRKTVGEIVFKDPDKLAILNRITHAAVRKDIVRWQNQQPSQLKFVETAILYQSEIDRMVDAVIEVTAPVNVRIERIQERNRLTVDEIMNRINAQNFTVSNPHPRVYTIDNNGKTAILPQVEGILKRL